MLPPGRQARHEAGADGVADLGHHDGDRRRGRLEGRERCVALNDEEVDLELNQLGDEPRKALGSVLGGAHEQGEVLVLRVTELPQPLTEGLEAGTEEVAPARQDTDPCSPGRLRRLSGDQRGVQGEDAEESERYRVHTGCSALESRSTPSRLPPRARARARRR